MKDHASEDEGILCYQDDSEAKRLEDLLEMSGGTDQWQEHNVVKLRAQVSYAVIVVSLLITLVESGRRVVVYVPAKKIKHVHHHHHHMVMIDPESKMMMPFAQLNQPTAHVQAGHLTQDPGLIDHTSLVHPHIYRPSPAAIAQNRNMRATIPVQVPQFVPAIPHRSVANEIVYPYVISEHIPQIVAAGRKRYNFEPIATGPANDRMLKYRRKPV